MTKKEKLKQKLNTLGLKLKASKDKFSQLPIHKKVVILSLFVAGLIFLIGTFAIIWDSIFVSEKDETNQEELIQELEELDVELNKVLDNYSYDTLEQTQESTDATFDEYREELEEIDVLLNTFEIPASAPIIQPISDPVDESEEEEINLDEDINEDE